MVAAGIASRNIANNGPIPLTRANARAFGIVNLAPNLWSADLATSELAKRRGDMPFLHLEAALRTGCGWKCNGEAPMCSVHFTHQMPRPRRGQQEGGKPTGGMLARGHVSGW